MKRPSRIYRLMCYFVHATICMYEKDCDSNDSMSVKEFRGKNEKIIERVFDEGLNIMNYELSHEQMSRGIASYLSSKYKPQYLETSEAYCLG